MVLHGILQVLKARAELVDNVFLLFPTIAHMHTTPNGKALSVCDSQSSRTTMQLNLVTRAVVVLPTAPKDDLSGILLDSFDTPISLSKTFPSMAG